MADISKKELRDEITAFLKDANLATTSAKKVRQHLEKKLDCDLSERKKEIDEMVMAWVKENQEDGNEEEPEEEEEDEESEEEKKPKKRSSPAKKKRNAMDSESEEDEGSDDDYSPKKKQAKKAKGGKKKGSDSDSDEWKEPKKKPAKKSGGGGGARKGGGGFTKVCNLSPALAAVVGAEQMARHDVVKKVWAIIKERNLYDPKNKQFAICDDQMQKVFGVKRFRTFGMMKYLKDHFVD